MNAIFIFAITISGIIIIFQSPDKLITAMQSGATSSLKLCVTLLALYAVWMGVFEILEKSGLAKKISKLLKRPLKHLFGELGEAEEWTTINVSANLLGLGGVATPSGIKACSIFDKTKNTYAKSMLFVLAATSLQLIPFSVISLRATLGSTSPADILLPSLISSFVCSTCGIILVKIFVKK